MTERNEVKSLCVIHCYYTGVHMFNSCIFKIMTTLRPRIWLVHLQPPSQKNPEQICGANVSLKCLWHLVVGALGQAVVLSHVQSSGNVGKDAVHHDGKFCGPGKGGVRASVSQRTLVLNRAYSFTFEALCPFTAVWDFKKQAVGA